MFRKLRIQFVLIATMAVVCMLILIIGILNASRYAVSEIRINKMLDLLAENDGELPELKKLEKILGRKINPDNLLQYRYFSVYLDEDDNVLSVRTDHILNLTESDILYYSDEVLQNNHIYGYFITAQGQRFAYKLAVEKDSGNKLIVALDYTNYYEDRADLVESSVFLFFSNLTFFIIIFAVFSGKVMKPFMENYRNQKAFITNASHELKTPLAIISANNELLEMMNGENEWTASTKEQVLRLSELINRLVTLAKFEEQSNLIGTNINFSKIVEKSSKSFTALAKKGGKNFETKIQSDILISGDGNAIYELVNILIDNANKYCDDNGTIGVKLYVHGRTFKRAKLEVYNTYKSGKNVDHSKFFERFYREDQSHSSNISGYGVGLSIARNIVRRHRGKIMVSYKNDTIYFNIYFNLVDK